VLGTSSAAPPAAGSTNSTFNPACRMAAGGDAAELGVTSFGCD
jgi:hypothetical protein